MPKKDTTGAIDKLKKYAADHLATVTTYYVNSSQAAMTVMATAKHVNRGILFLESKFARGFDIKFAVKSCALILDLGHKLHSSTVIQMVGRTDRA